MGYSCGFYKFSVYTGDSEYINSNAILTVNYATFDNLGYNYVNIMTNILQYFPMRMTNSQYVIYSVNLYMCSYD